MTLDDFLTPSCASSDENPAEFYDYTNECIEEDARLQALGFSLVGNTIACPTDSTEITNAQTAKTFTVVTGITGSENDPTPNTEDLSAFSCRSDEAVIDYTYSLSVEVLRNPSNYKFWNAIAENSDLVGQVMYVNKSGVNYLVPTKPSIKIGQGINGNFGVMKLEITWKSKSLPKPFKSLSTVFSCAA